MHGRATVAKAETGRTGTLLRRARRRAGSPHGDSSDLLMLQRIVGNRAVGEIIRERRAAGATHGGPGAIQRDEAWEQVKRIGPYDAWRAKQAADTAVAEAKASGLPGLWNGPADAFRHALWNCLMARTIGPEQAASVADTHEEFGANHPNERLMDDHNNRTGLLLGDDKKQKDKPETELVKGALDSGQLLVIPNYKEVAAGKGAVTPEKPVRSNALKP